MTSSVQLMAWRPSGVQNRPFLGAFSATQPHKGNRIIETYGAGDGNRTNPNEPNKGVTTRFSVQLESNGVRSCEGWSAPMAIGKSEYWECGIHLSDKR